MGSAPGHICLHVKVEHVATREVCFVESLFVAQGVSLVPEEVQGGREAGMVLVKAEIYNRNIRWLENMISKLNFFLCKVHKY